MRLIYCSNCFVAALFNTITDYSLKNENNKDLNLFNQKPNM